MAALKTKPRLIQPAYALADPPLREDFVRGPGSLTVDRAAGVIRGVKCLGWYSTNDGGKRRYLPEGINANLYEGVPVYDGHKPIDARSGTDPLGVIRNPVKRADGIYGDLHYYQDANKNPSGPLLEKVVNDAERGFGVYGMSHNVPPGHYKSRRESDGTVTITEITKVESVDIVLNPATTHNLQESQPKGQPMAKIKLPALFESLSVNVKIPKATRKQLMDYDLPAAVSLIEMDEPGAEADPMATLKAGYKAAVNALMDGALDGDGDAMKQVMALVKSHAKLAGKPETEEDENADGKTDTGKTGAGDDSKKESKAVSKTPQAPALTESRAKSLIKLAGVKEDTALVESLTGMTEAGALKALEWAKTQQATPAAKGNDGLGFGPRSSAPGVAPQLGKDGKPLTESASAIPLGFDDDSRAKRLQALRGGYVAAN